MLLQTRAQAVEIAHQKRRMRLERWTKFLLDAEMQLLGAEREPDAAAHFKVRRLFQLRQTEQAAIEGARFGFLAARHRQQQMIERDDAGHRGHFRCMLTATGGPLLIV